MKGSIYRMGFALIAAATLLIFVVGCASGDFWKWSVTRFHTLDVVREKTFTIVPLRSVYNDSLEFMEYAKLVAGKLGNYGMIYRSQNELGKTDFIVGLDYGIGEPYQINYSYPIYGQTGGGTHTSYSGTIRSNGQNANYSGTASTAPTYGVVGSDTGSITNYHQYVRLFIYDGKAADSIPLKRYEGKAEGAGYLNDLTKIVPSGLKALLMEFPGKSGSSKTETLLGLDQKP